MVEVAPKSSRTFRGIGAALVVLALAVSGYVGWKPQASRSKSVAAAPAAVPVQVATVVTGDIPIYLDGLGSVQAFNTVTVRSRVDGQIDRIAFTEGQMVNQGDLIAQIDPRPFQAALDQAVAKKTQDEAQLVSAKADLERTRELLTRDFATKQQFDDQQATVNSQSAQIQADQAAIDNAQTQLGYTTIRAPISGRTGFLQIDQGNIIHATDTSGIVDITQVQPISVVFTAPEAELAGINKAQAEKPLTAWAISSNGKDVLGEGQLTLVNNQVDTTSGTIRLKAQFENKDHALWPGLSVNTRLLLRTLKNVVAVPGTAVQRGPQGLFAYVVKPDRTVEMRNLDVGVITSDKAVIQKGLSVGEIVVTSGQYRLQPGATVQVAGGSPQRVAEER